MKLPVASLFVATLLTAPAAFAQTATAPAGAPAEVAPVTTGSQKTYDPQGRRDPFVSLMRRGEVMTPAARRAGLAGLGADEVSLRGTLQSRGSFVGILEGADQKTYIARAGDQLLDGTIRSISADAMVIAQQVDDPLSVQHEREVRKLLRQSEGAR